MIQKTEGLAEQAVISRSYRLYLFQMAVDRPVQFGRDAPVIGIILERIDKIGCTYRCEFAVTDGCVWAVIAHLYLILFVIEFRSVLDQDVVKSEVL